jgi:hypothetical protein
MSFTPIINVTSIPRDASGFVFTDITGDYPTNPTGFGAANAPANRAAITVVWGEAQLLGAEPIHAGNVSGSLDTAITVQLNIVDGVQWLRAYYGRPRTITFTVSEDRKTLSTSDPDLVDIMDSVGAVGKAIGDFPVRVSSVTSTTVILEEALPGADLAYLTLYTYYIAQTRKLVLNCGESLIANSIARMPSYRTDCKNGMEILDKILLKLGAEYAFFCGNYSEAHTSAQMICGTNYSSSNCISCGS